MAIDSAVKRRAAAGITFPLGPGVTPDATPDEVWRAAVAWGYVAAASSVTAVLTGTSVPQMTEAQVVTGGRTTIITLTNDTFVAAGTGPIGSTADTQALIDGITSAQAEATGWNAVVRDTELTTSVVRTSDTVATITWTAAATYDITRSETITVTVPAAVLTGGNAVVASPVFRVAAAAVATGAKSNWQKKTRVFGFTYR